MGAKLGHNSQRATVQWLRNTGKKMTLSYIFFLRYIMWYNVWKYRNYHPIHAVFLKLQIIFSSFGHKSLSSPHKTNPPHKSTTLGLALPPPIPEKSAWSPPLLVLCMQPWHCHERKEVFEKNNPCFLLNMGCFTHSNFLKMDLCVAAVLLTYNLPFLTMSSVWTLCFGY